MPHDTPILPEFRDWSIAAVHLLKGVVGADDGSVWNILLSNRSKLEDYLGRLGLRLSIAEEEGFAFLQQIEDEELPAGYERLPKLFRKIRLSYDATLLSVILRDELRRFDEEELQHERCVIAKAALFEQWKAFFPASSDEIRLNAGLDKALSMLEEMKFVRPFSKDPEEWEIRRVIKARLPVEKLETLLETLTNQAVAGKTSEQL